MPGFSKKAKRHAKESRRRTEKMLKDAPRRSGEVTVSWLPGFGPPQEPKPVLSPQAKLPIRATINGRKAIVYEDRIEYE